MIAHFSPSRIELYQQCPRAFYYSYVANLQPCDETTRFYAAYGSLFHAIAEQFAVDPHYTAEMAVADYVEGFNHLKFDLKAGRVPREDYFEQGLSAIKRLDKRKVKNMVAVEEGFTVEWVEGLPPLHGYIDRIDRIDDQLVVFDYKSSRVYTDSEMHKKVQPVVYAIFVYHTYGVIPRFFYYFFRFHQYREVRVTLEDMRRFKHQLADLWSRLKEGQFAPKPQRFYCENFCGYRSMCEAYQGTVGS